MRESRLLYPYQSKKLRFDGSRRQHCRSQPTHQLRRLILFLFCFVFGPPKKWTFDARQFDLSTRGFCGERTSFVSSTNIFFFFGLACLELPETESPEITETESPESQKHCSEQTNRLLQFVVTCRGTSGTGGSGFTGTMGPVFSTAEEEEATVAEEADGRRGGSRGGRETHHLLLPAFGSGGGRRGEQ